MISKRADEDEDHGELDEGEVVVGFAVAAGRDSGSCFKPGVGAFDWPAVAGESVGAGAAALFAAPDFAGWCAVGDRLAGSASFADSWLDSALAERLFERGGVVAAVGPELGGPDLAGEQLVDERE